MFQMIYFSLFVAQWLDIALERPTNDRRNTNGDAGTGGRITEAYYEMRSLILSHQIAPGTPIIQARIAEELEHSRGTVRAALKRLDQEGYVVEKALGTYSRFVVAPLTVEDMEELYSLCGALEGLAARQCAQLDSAPRTRLADRMELLNREPTVKAEEGNLPPEEANGWDENFHQAFLAETKGSRLLTQIHFLRPQVGRYRNFYITRVTPKARVIASPEHQRIVEAIRAQRPDEAQRAIERHWRAGARRLRQSIEEVGEHRGYAKR